MRGKKYLMMTLGVALIIALIVWAGVEDSLEIVMGASSRPLVLAILMQVLATFAWALRWRVFLNKAGIRPGTKDLLMAVMIGVFVNNITPGARAGGEPARTYFIGKRTNSGYGAVFATVMADRILDVIPVMVFTFIAFKYALDGGNRLLLLVLGVSTLSLAVVLLLTVLFSYNERLALGLVKRTLGLVRRLFPGRFSKVEENIEERIRKTVMEFRETLVDLSKDPAVFFKTLLYSFALWGFMVLRTYFVFESISHPLPLSSIVMVQMAGIAIGMISVIPGGLGVTEGINSALYLSLSLKKSIAVTATVVDRFISFWLPSIVGGGISLYLSVRADDSDEVRRDSET